MRGETLTQFTLRGQRKNPGASGEFTSLLNDIGSACKTIAHAVRRGALSGTLGVAGSQNVQGEPQKTLDLIANQLFIQSVEWTGHIGAMVSEENEDIIAIPKEYPRGKYLVCFDPLDGSSNIDVNLSVGTIFSILRSPQVAGAPITQDFLQPGVRQVAAGFCVYGPSTQLILTVGEGVFGFTLDQDIGEFVMTHPNMRIPEATAEFAINMSNRRYWEPPVERYIDELIKGIDGDREKNFNMRWVASMVAEVYRILIRGGIFLYPTDTKDPSRPARLRLMYEANPMAFIVEQAGGAASTGRQRILDIKPSGIHERVPVILGSKSEVERVIRYHESA